MRHGSEQGRVTSGSARVRVRRQRVRAGDDEHESSPLAPNERFTSADLLAGGVVFLSGFSMEAGQLSRLRALAGPAAVQVRVVLVSGPTQSAQNSAPALARSSPAQSVSWASRSDETPASPAPMSPTSARPDEANISASTGEAGSRAAAYFLLAILSGSEAGSPDSASRQTWREPPSATRAFSTKAS
jgi:hypothetical protein